MNTAFFSGKIPAANQDVRMRVNDSYHTTVVELLGEFVILAYISESDLTRLDSKS